MSFSENALAPPLLKTAITEKIFILHCFFGVWIKKKRARRKKRFHLKKRKKNVFFSCFYNV
jgi:hypothetical protein